MRKGLLACALVAVLAGCGGAHVARTVGTTTTVASAKKRHDPPRVVHVVEHRVGSLASAVQDAAAVGFGHAALLVGGLTAADVSTNEIVAAPGGVRGHIPTALHDAAAARIGRDVYLFGGGDGVRQLAGIDRVSPGAPARVGTLPAPSSDQSGATVNGTAYIVGGYTGTQWLDTIVAWRPGALAAVVGRLPHALRYAAVAAADGKVVIAGGSTPQGTASRAVYVFDPRTRRVSRAGMLPAPTTHAAAASLNGLVYVIGGRGAALNTPVTSIEAVDPVRLRTMPAGDLATPRSDLAAVSGPGRILLAGGRGPGGTVATLSSLVPQRAVVAHMPALLNVHDVYAADTPSGLRGPAREALPRIYVPNSRSNTVDVIDPATYKVVAHYDVGVLPQHVVPAYDLAHLYVTNDVGNSLTEIDPKTARPVRTLHVDDPYNMYFTPDGQYAIVVAERLQRLDFRDAHTFALVKSVPTPCSGVDHMDFTADGTYALVSCEFSRQMLVLNVPEQRIVKVIGGHGLGMPQDVKLSPDGSVFYVADTVANGVWIFDAHTFRLIGFVHTGRGAHGLYPSRDARDLYVSNRGEGTVSVLSFRTRKVVEKWTIPGGGSPDMGGVSVDGKVLWLSGRYSGVVYAISTVTGKLLAKIPVGVGPHGLCVWPQPGRYSLGHTGILR